MYSVAIQKNTFSSMLYDKQNRITGCPVRSAFFYWNIVLKRCGPSLVCKRHKSSCSHLDKSMKPQLFGSKVKHIGKLFWGTTSAQKVTKASAT